MKKFAFVALVALEVLATIVVTSSVVRAEKPVELGQFSLSLEVKDIRKSKEFYEKLGFEKIVGSIEQKFLILRISANNAVIGLFQDEWKGFKLTFNPTDVRGLQSKLKKKGVKFDTEATAGSGPAFAELKDPDGHLILLDQH